MIPTTPYLLVAVVQHLLSHTVHERLQTLLLRAIVDATGLRHYVRTSSHTVSR